ncbi:D-alanyl-D-alanine carboxypeptidase family protein [Croceicoccus sp. F390]|uniref:serine-type D-Ala-D-Ala carboxypeptidase n=1 Tax=Croceicoccus esteveae TaxID=3075597 RepID=A0ABU2ZM41_9SPHN|nr:D-alanyl-D-alanine carboxypeptidase family protein [Croceicoccus sp. F390]MDT0576644.1 D-alanyl-D-alanine carboxypeptidase family protein [Croceicoccus sp. F390]
MQFFKMSGHLPRRVIMAVAAAGLVVPMAPVAQSRAAAPAPPAIVEAAPIALLQDLSSGQTLFSREADRQFIPASLTKLMTTYAVFELIDKQQVSLHQMITVDAETAKRWSGRGSSMYLRAGDKVSVDQLLAGIVTVSANDGCIALAKGLAGSVEGFTRIMNANAHELGMRDSHFNTPNGWPDEGRTYTSGRDLATLAKALIQKHPEKYRRYFSMPEFTWNGRTQKNHNPILNHVPGADGLKTGFTNEAGFGFVGSAEQENRRLVMIIANTDSSRDRKDIARAFMTWGFNAWKSRSLLKEGAIMGAARVQGGATQMVPLMMAEALAVTEPRSGPGGATPPPQLSIRYLGPIDAPIRKGQMIASLEVKSGDEEARSVPLLAAHDVAEANWWQRLRNGLSGLAG